jgi:hypothetical protein
MPDLEKLPAKSRILLATTFRFKESDDLWKPHEGGFQFKNTDGVRDGVTRQTLDNWQEGTKPEFASLERLCIAMNHSLRLPRELKVQDFYDGVSLPEFCAAVGFADGQSILRAYYTDKLITNRPHTDFIFDTRKGATSLAVLNDKFVSVRGLYHVYRMDRRTKSVARLGMVVPTFVPVTDRVDEKRYSIAAEMTIPHIDGKRKYNYTGEICLKHDLVTWEFLQDNHDKHDFANMTTDRGDDGREDRQRVGVMATRRQNGTAALPITYPIVARRTTETFAYSDIADFLNAAAEIAPDDVDEELRQLLEQSDM